MARTIVLTAVHPFVTKEQRYKSGAKKKGFNYGIERRERMVLANAIKPKIIAPIMIHQPTSICYVRRGRREERKTKEREERRWCVNLEIHQH